MPESVAHRAIAFPSALCTLSKRGRSSLYVVNPTKSVVNLSAGTQLCTLLTYPADVDILEYPQNAIDMVSTQDIPNTPDFMSHLQPTQFPESQENPVNLLSKYYRVIVLPGEVLGKTDIGQHHIQLKENTQPVYIPAY